MIIFLDGTVCTGKTTFIKKHFEGKFPVLNFLKDEDKPYYFEFAEMIKRRDTDHLIDMCERLSAITGDRLNDVLRKSLENEITVVDRSPASYFFFQYQTLQEYFIYHTDKLNRIERTLENLRMEIKVDDLFLFIFTKDSLMKDVSYEELSEMNKKRIESGEKDVNAVYRYTPYDLSRQDDFFGGLRTYKQDGYFSQFEILFK